MARALLLDVSEKTRHSEGGKRKSFRIYIMDFKWSAPDPFDAVPTETNTKKRKRKMWFNNYKAKNELYTILKEPQEGIGST